MMEFELQRLLSVSIVINSHSTCRILGENDKEVVLLDYGAITGIVKHSWVLDI